MKLAFFGTPAFAADILKGILSFSDIEVSLVVSQPDKAVGRKQEFIATPVKEIALQNSIPVLQPERFRNNPFFVSELQMLELDFVVVVAYGSLIPQEILDIPKYGCINIHGSVLPQYRGASPVQAAVKNGDTQTGLTIMYMNHRMDEGDILAIEKVTIDADDTSPDVFQKFVDIGPKLLYQTLSGVFTGKIQATAQNHSVASYCHMIERYQGEVRFSKKTAQEIYNLYRAYQPWPGIYTLLNGKKVILEKVSLMQPLSCEAGIPLIKGEDREITPGTFVQTDKKSFGVVCADRKILLFHQVKPEGKKSMDIVSFVNGNKKILNSQLI